MQTPLYALNAVQLSQGYKNKDFTPSEVARDCLDRIRTYNPALNAFCYLNEEDTLAQAKQSDLRWQKQKPASDLDGVPISIKDLLLSKDWPTLRGSHTAPSTGPWAEDSPPVARLREAGVVMLGKTTTPEFAWKGVTDSPRYGVTRNPWDLNLTPGGSSGGASAAVATGMGPIALGTDAGGSLRIPAAMCGLFTIKPTGGRVPSYPPTPYGSFAASGPISWTVEDAARFLDVISQTDPRDWSALPVTGDKFAASVARHPKRLRIGWSEDLGFAKPQPGIVFFAEKAITQLEDLGHQVEKIISPFSDPTDAYEDLREGMTVSAFSRMSDEQLVQMDPGLVAHILHSRKNATLEKYLAAQAKRLEIGRQMNAFHENFDLLLTPALACRTFDVGMDGPEGLATSREWSPYTFPFNLTKQPAVTLPCGVDEKGLPLAVQLVGPLYSEALLLQISHQFEQAYPWVRSRATPALNSETNGMK